MFGLTQEPQAPIEFKFKKRFLSKSGSGRIVEVFTLAPGSHSLVVSLEPNLKAGHSTKIRLHEVDLVSPVDYEEIYRAAVAVIEDLRDENGRLPKLIFHLSPGTSTMAAVWLLLAAIRYDADLVDSSREHGLRDVELPFEIAAEFVPALLSRSDQRIGRLAQAKIELDRAFNSIVHRSESMAAVLRNAELIAPLSVPVLIQFESGTGKELLARAIHERSSRSTGSKNDWRDSCSVLQALVLRAPSSTFAPKIALLAERLMTQSQNFGYLAAHDEQLARYGALVEHYFALEPRDCVVKLRQMAECMAQLATARMGLEVSHQDSFLDVLRIMQRSGSLPDEAADIFHFIRKQGNSAVHQHDLEVTHGQALHFLKLCRALATWFHLLVSGRAGFNPAHSCRLKIRNLLTMPCATNSKNFASCSPTIKKPLLRLARPKLNARPRSRLPVMISIL